MYKSLPTLLLPSHSSVPALPLRQDVAARLQGSPCQLLVTEACHAEGPRLLYMLQRWLPLVLHIRRECAPGGWAVPDLQQHTHLLGLCGCKRRQANKTLCHFLTLSRNACPFFTKSCCL